MAHIESLIPSQRVRAILEISATTETNMRERGALPMPIKIGRANYYLREELERQLGLPHIDFHTREKKHG